MPQDDSRTSGKLLLPKTAHPALAAWQRTNEEGFVAGSDAASVLHHRVAMEYVQAKGFCPESEFVHHRDCYYRRNHCHIESRNGARFVRPSECSKFMLKSGEALIQQQLTPGHPKQKWLPVYHGTHPDNVASILRHGLVKPGTTVSSAPPAAVPARGRAQGSAVPPPQTVATAHGAAYGAGVYTSMMPLYAQLYAQPEQWVSGTAAPGQRFFVQTFFMLCQSPESVYNNGRTGASTRSLIGRNDVHLLYGGHIAEGETQFMTRDPQDLILCALMVKVHDTNPTAAGGELHHVAHILEGIASVVSHRADLE